MCRNFAKMFPHPLVQKHDTVEKKKKYKLLPKYAVLVSQVESEHCVTSTLKFNQRRGGEGVL